MTDVKVEIVPDTEELPEGPEVKEGKVVYESDLRAGAHSNGWAPDLLGAEVAAGGRDVPPQLPDEPSFGRKPEGQGGNLLAYGLAATYLVAGAAALWVGFTMLRELRGGKKKGERE